MGKRGYEAVREQGMLLGNVGSDVDLMTEPTRCLK